MTLKELIDHLTNAGCDYEYIVRGDGSQVRYVRRTDSTGRKREVSFRLDPTDPVSNTFIDLVCRRLDLKRHEVISP